MVDDAKCGTCGCILNDETWGTYHRKTNRFICKQCNRERDAKYRKNLSFKQRLRKKIRQSLDNHRYDGIEIIGSIEEFIHTYTGECAYCGMEFDIFSSDRNLSGSLDRIHNDDTMSPDNVQWLCLSCNRSKNNKTHDEYMEYVKMLYEKFIGGD